VAVQLEVGRGVQLLANVGARLAGRVETHGGVSGRRPIQRIAGLVQSENVVLEKAGNPLGRIYRGLEVQVVDVFPSNGVDVAKVVVTEGKLLIERGELSPGGVADRCARSVVLIGPQLWLHRQVHKGIPESRRAEAGVDVAI
jgi:hypothetical protein